MADTEDTTEEWRAIPGFGGGYSASSAGRVRRNVAVRGDPGGGHIYHPALSERGYLRVRFAGRRSFSVHRLVFEAFVRPLRDGEEINHIDGVKTHNRPENLEAVDSLGNKAHAGRLGLIPYGSTRPGAKLTEDDVVAIRARHRAGESVISLGESFGISSMTAWTAATRRSWKHVKG